MTAPTPPVELPEPDVPCMMDAETGENHQYWKRDKVLEAHESGRQQGLREAAEICREQVNRWESDGDKYVANECVKAIRDSIKEPHHGS